MKAAASATPLPPPLSLEEKEAELEALRYVIVSLIRCLHARGMVDFNDMASELAEGMFVFSGKQRQRESVQWYIDTMNYMETKWSSAAD